jgi:arabinose-5-phosphate isomerase
MTHSPRTIRETALATEAAHLMDKQRLNHLAVTDDRGQVVGAIGLHDLLEAKVI